MSGHSKWANIKHKKEKSDSIKGKVFTKLGRELAVAVKAGGPDPEANARLKDVIAAAKAENMSNESIERSIKKASGDVNTASYEEITYQGYGPEGVAIIVEAMTDNRNRTAADVRHIFDKHGGNMGTTGCVDFLFAKKGVILIEKTKDVNEDEIMLDAIEAGAEDVNVEDEYIEILTGPSELHAVKTELENKHKIESADIDMIPSTYISIADEKHAESMAKLIDEMEEYEDVHNVYHNWEQAE
ncbi:MAG: YebC/PmpR family DNA-binding transcriptional regulator [Eubacteriales bacterium]|nr:YebC/PmpR family DNA-binding transcriptional regulator [Eubacteriales bacterium]